MKVLNSALGILYVIIKGKKKNHSKNIQGPAGDGTVQFEIIVDPMQIEYSVLPGS